MPNLNESLMIVFTGIIAVMAIAQFVVFKRQWKVMRGQLREMKTTSTQLDGLVQQATDNAKAGKDNAEAALLNAKALMNSERALIALEIIRYQGGGDSYRFCAVNHGRTPAEILSYTLGHSSVPSPIRDLPDSLGTDVGLHNIHDLVLPGDEPFTLEVFDVKEFLQFRDQGETLVVRGSVKYLDVFGSDCESSIVYSWSEDRKTLVRLSRYTRFKR